MLIMYVAGRHVPHTIITLLKCAIALDGLNALHRRLFLNSRLSRQFNIHVDVLFNLSRIHHSPPSGFEQKKKTQEKNAPFWEKNPTISAKKALFGIISFLKRVFCLPLLHKISPFNVFKTINYLFLFFNNFKNLLFYKTANIFNDHNFTYF